MQPESASIAGAPIDELPGLTVAQAGSPPHDALLKFARFDFTPHKCLPPFFTL